MATLVYMKNPSNNRSAKAYVGFSWSAFFLGPLPLLTRKEWGFFLIFLVLYIIISAVTLGIGGLVLSIIWAFYFNKWHMRRLIKNGYAIDESQPAGLVAEAKAQAGIA